MAVGLNNYLKESLGGSGAAFGYNSLVDKKQAAIGKTQEYARATLGMDNSQFIDMSNIYNKTFSQVEERFKEAQDRLQNYFQGIEDSVQTSYQVGLDRMNQEFSGAIKSLNDVAEPFKQSALVSQQQYRNFLGIGDWSPEQVQMELEKTPGYQFQLEQGQQAIERSAAAKGNLVSGNTLTELTKFGQGMAQSAYQDRLNQLMGLMGVSSQAYTGLASQAAGLQASQGQANLQAQMSKGDLLANLQSNLGGQQAGLLAQQAGLESQLGLSKAQLLENMRATNLSNMTNRLNQMQQTSATLGAAQIGAAGGIAKAQIGAGANREAIASNERIAGLNATVQANK